MATLTGLLDQLSQPNAPLPSLAYAKTRPTPTAIAPTAPAPAVDVTTLPGQQPAALTQQLGQQPRAGQGSPLYGSMPDNIKKMQNKWSKLGPELRGTIDDHIIESVIDFDSQRVSTGGQPLTEDQTRAVFESITSNKQATPEPKRNPLSLIQNTIGDLGAIVKSIPHIPAALFNEVKELPHIPEAINKNLAAGQNPLQAITNAPGVRMIPGSYLVGNLTDPAELARHPLFTALDVLPVAHAAAGATAVGRAAEEAATMAGREARPIGAVLTKTLDEGGQLVDNRLGRGVDFLKNETRPGRTIQQIWGEQSRDVMRTFELQGAKLKAIRDGVSAPSTDTEAFMARAAKLRTQYGFDDSKIAALTTRAQMSDYAGLAPDELSFLDEARQLGTAYGRQRVGDGSMGAVAVNGVQEFYPKAQADAITGARDVATRTKRISDARHEMVAPSGTVNLDTFQRAFQQAAADGSPRLGNLEAQTIARTMQAYGYDIKPFVGGSNRLSATRSAADYAKAFTDARASGLFDATERIIPLNELVAQLKSAKSDVLADRLATALRDGNNVRVTQTLDGIMQRIEDGRPPIANDPDFVRSVRAHRDIRGLDSTKLSRYTNKRVTSMETRAERIVDRHAPARFGPMIAERTRKQFGDRYLAGVASPEEAARLTQAVAEARWGSVAPQLGLASDDVAKLYRGIEDDVAATWTDLQQKGANPIFVHRVGRGRAQTVLNPRIGPVPTSISQDMERALDFSPGVDDITVALTHQGMELLSRDATELAIDDIVGKYGVREADIREMYADRARDAAGTSGGPAFEQSLRDLVDRRFERFNPDERGYNWGGAKLDKYRQEGYFIPKPIAENLHTMASPKGAISAALDPISKTFRLSVVGLSPRTQLYNILGGATMLLGQTGPSVFKFYKQAREWMKNPAAVDNEVVRATLGSTERMFEGSEFARADAGVKYAYGKTLGRWMNDHLAFATKGGGKITKVVDWMLEKNSMVDDQYRAMAYLYGYDKALTKGLTDDVARRSGETLMRKTMMDYTGMTPFERTVFKSIFPFYGFMSHAMRYVARYPLDHPMRAQVVAAFAQSEQEDLGALPGSFLGMLAVGKPDSENRQNWLNTAALNPFGDVANMFTVAGFLGATNPVLNTAFEQAGLTRGEAELYPTLRYDPESGRLAAVHQNPLTSFLANTIPQTQLVTALLGFNGEFENMMRRDPAAAHRFLLSNAGLPITHRQYNISAEIAKGEVARQRSADLAKTSALESGDWTEAMRYPSLNDTFDQINQIPAETLAQFSSPEQKALSGYVKQVTGLDASAVAANPGASGPSQMSTTGGI